MINPSGYFSMTPIRKCNIIISIYYTIMIGRDFCLSCRVYIDHTYAEDLSERLSAYVRANPLNTGQLLDFELLVGFAVALKKYVIVLQTM